MRCNEEASSAKPSKPSEPPEEYADLTRNEHAEPRIPEQS